MSSSIFQLPHGNVEVSEDLHERILSMDTQGDEYQGLVNRLDYILTISLKETGERKTIYIK